MQASGSIGTSQKIKQVGSSDSTPVQGGDNAHSLDISHGRRADMAESESEPAGLATPPRTPNPAEVVTPASDLTATPFSAHVSSEARVRLAVRPVSPAQASPLASSLPNLSAIGLPRETWNEGSPYRGRSNSGNSSNNSSRNNSSRNNNSRDSSNTVPKKAPSRSPSPVKALQKTTTLRSLSTPARLSTATPVSSASSAALGAEPQGGPQSPRSRPHERAHLSPTKLQLESRLETPAASNDTTQVYATTISLMGLLIKVPALREKSRSVATDLQSFATQLLEDHPDRKALRHAFDRFRGALEDHVVARNLLAQIECSIGFLPELSPEKPDPRLSGLRRQVADSLAEFSRLGNQ